MTGWRVLLLFSFAILASAGDRTIAQFVHRTWTAKDGAPVDIWGFTQTSDGYLWLASNQGLYRFDGIDFEHYQPPFGPPLPPQAVRSLLALPNGDLWVGYWDSGVSLLRNGTNRNFTREDGLPAGRVLGMVQDRQGAIWAGTRNGLARFDGARWRQIGWEDGFKGRTAASVYLDRNGTLWVASVIGSAKSARYCNPQTGLFGWLKPPGQFESCRHRRRIQKSKLDRSKFFLLAMAPSGLPRSATDFAGFVFPIA